MSVFSPGLFERQSGTKILRTLRLKCKFKPVPIHPVAGRLKKEGPGTSYFGVIFVHRTRVLYKCREEKCPGK